MGEWAAVTHPSEPGGGTFRCHRPFGLRCDRLLSHHVVNEAHAWFPLVASMQ